MTDIRGGMVRFTKLRRNHVSDGVFELVADGDFWIPERSYTVTAASHTQPDATVINYSRIVILDTNERLDALEDVETVMVRQEAGLEQTRYTEAQVP